PRPVRPPCAKTVRAKRKRANHSFPERKALRRHRGPRIKIVQRSLSGPAPRSCIRNRSQENSLKRTEVALALPSYDRQRLSGIRRGWCPSRPKKPIGCSVPTLALLTACREVRAFYKRRVVKSRRNSGLETPLALAESGVGRGLPQGARQ